MSIERIIDDMEKQGFKTSISIVWSAEDVLSIDEELTAEQVNDVLNYLERKHDASIGINWEVIRNVIDYIKDN